MSTRACLAVSVVSLTIMLASLTTGAMASPIAIRGTRVVLERPEGFTEATNFPGFLQASTNSSVMVTEIPGPFSKVTSGFTAERLKPRGMNLKSKKSIVISSYPGTLIHLTQRASGVLFSKWIVIFGNQNQTVMITATFPSESKKNLSGLLRNTVLSVKWNKSQKVDPFEGLNFRISASGQMKLAKRIGNSLLYTRGGVFPVKSPKDPIFIVGNAFSNIQASDRKQYAEKRLFQTQQIKNISIENGQEISIDDLAGYRIIASSSDVKTGTPIAVFQVLLFTEQSYIIMQGFVGAENKKVFLTEFNTMAESFKRKQN